MIPISSGPWNLLYALQFPYPWFNPSTSINPNSPLEADRAVGLGVDVSCRELAELFHLCH